MEKKKKTPTPIRSMASFLKFSVTMGEILTLVPGAASAGEGELIVKRYTLFVSHFPPILWAFGVTSGKRNTMGYAMTLSFRQSLSSFPFASF